MLYGLTIVGERHCAAPFVFKSGIALARHYTSEEVLEPIIIERMYPEGYMIVNGHHRWGAYLKSGRKRMRVRLVNLTSVSDIVEMLKESRNDKRATFDLDEVLFVSPISHKTEPELFFPCK